MIVLVEYIWYESLLGDLSEEGYKEIVDKLSNIRIYQLILDSQLLYKQLQLIKEIISS